MVALLRGDRCGEDGTSHDEEIRTGVNRFGGSCLAGLIVLPGGFSKYSFWPHSGSQSKNHGHRLSECPWLPARMPLPPSTPALLGELRQLHDAQFRRAH